MTRTVTLRYMLQFRCIGPDCEDTCCAGWTVPVDALHRDKLHLALAKTGEEARLATALVPPPLESPTEDTAAVLQHRDDGTCVFLEPSKWCELHRRFGEESLPDACSMYPKQVSRAGERLELTGGVSCPEVARRALLAEDATDVVPCEPALLGRGVVGQSTPPDVRSPYAQVLDHVRGVMFGLFTLRHYPVTSRAFFLADFAERMGEYLTLASTSLDEARFAAEIARVEDEGNLAKLDEVFRATEVPPGLAVNVLLKVVAMRLESRALPTFRGNYVATMKHLAAAGAGVSIGDAVDTLRVEPDELGAWLAAHRAERDARWGDRLDLVLTNYAKNWVMRDWYVFSPTLAAHVQKLVVNLGLLRFLLLSDPRLDAAAAAGPDALDKLAVEVVYSFARTIEHSDELIALIVDKLVAGVPALAVAVALLKV